MRIMMLLMLGTSLFPLLPANVKEDIAAAEREGLALTRHALVTSWRAQERALMDKEVALGRYAYAYREPAWQPALRRFDGTFCTAVDYSFSYLTNSFDLVGNLVNSSVVRFGKKPILSDILISSALASDPKATPGVGYEFLQDLSATQIPFQASIATHECVLSCLIGFAKNRFQVGVRLPLRQQFRSLSIEPVLSSSVRSLLRTATDDEPLRNAQFRGFYGVSVAAMIKDVIAQKNMIYRERLTHSSFGDISVLAAMHAAPLGVERWSWSAELLIPSEKTIETAYFYPLIPESLGCLSARISTGIIGKMTVFGSPYVTASGQVYFSSAINCRVPRLVTVTAATALPETEVFGGELSFFPVATFSTPETTLPDFAGQTTTAKVRPGFVFDFQAGSIIHPSISPLAQLDLYYHVRLREPDQFGDGLLPSVWYTTALVSSAGRVAHSLGASLAYQPTSSLLVRAGFEGVVAGCSVPVEVKANLFISASF